MQSIKSIATKTKETLSSAKTSINAAFSKALSSSNLFPKYEDIKAILSTCSYRIKVMIKMPEKEALFKYFSIFCLVSSCIAVAFVFYYIYKECKKDSLLKEYGERSINPLYYVLGFLFVKNLSLTTYFHRNPISVFFKAFNFLNCNIYSFLFLDALIILAIIIYLLAVRYYIADSSAKLPMKSMAMAFIVISSVALFLFNRVSPFTFIYGTLGTNLIAPVILYFLKVSPSSS